MKKILITRTDRMGDVVLSTPALKAVREHFPKSHIAVLVRPYTKECIEGNPYIDEIIIYDKYGKHKKPLDSFKFAMDLKKKRFDLAIALHPTNRVHLTLFLAGIPERIGYNKKLGFLLTKRIPHEKQHGQKHELDYTLDVIKALGVDPVNKALHMPLKKETQEEMDKRLLEAGISKKDKIITIHPSSSCPSKKWPAERFSRVADRLIEEYNIKVVLIAGAGNKNDSLIVKRCMKHKAVDFSGETSIPELASLLKRSDLFISNDSGPVHVASAVGTPAIVIFGRKDKGLGPKRWGPTGKSDIILHKDAGCIQCLAHNCAKEFLCLKMIKEDDVIKAVKACIK